VQAASRGWLACDRRGVGGTQKVAEVVRAILGQARLQGWQIGTTRVFLRAGQLAALEVHRVPPTRDGVCRLTF